jgi:rhamnose utilization protein RhaD (predicted bifunctional aldolase and dehydrogenase)/NAD(P)-dependent dehydrogenase (short-subunit alcohol dehydrogenase family)
MQNLWSDADAAEMVRTYREKGVGEDLALRVYSSRLLGREPRLVQHGGGNTSLKSITHDLLGAPLDVLHVKGSGWDLGDIEPEGLPAVRMAPLIQLRQLETLPDEAMVEAQRGALMQFTSPNPSVETLLHAWIAPIYVDHTHANAVLALTDQPRGEALCRELYGERLAIVPYVMPGFSLAHAAARAFEANPQAEGMILLKHGIFSWGDTAKEAYDRMILFVSMAEDRLASTTGRRSEKAEPAHPPALAALTPALRGALTSKQPDGALLRIVLDHRASPQVLSFAQGQALMRYSQAGLATPDHVIRIKPWPLVIEPPPGEDPTAFGQAARAAVQAYISKYRSYFARNNALVGGGKTMLDPMPRWVVIPRVGLFGVGASKAQAAVAADIAETTVSVILDAERLDRFESISESQTFEMEYWSLEQAKLGKGRPPPLAGHIVAVTGGAGAIGFAVAKAFAAKGAEVVILDRVEEAVKGAADKIKGLGLACDVTSPNQVRAAFDRIAETYGGLDIVVSNAGAAFTGAIGEVSDAVLRESFELNFFAHQAVAQAAVRIMRRQGTGGVLLFNASKQAVNPGLDFGPYGLPKAATIALMRQYALEYGPEGIRANAINADRIRSGLLTDAMVAARSKARGVSETDYLAGNLLGREVTADDVAEAFLALAMASKTTAAVLTVDGGNIAAALR